MPNYYPNGKGGYSVYDDDWNLVSEMPGNSEEPSITISPAGEPSGTSATKAYWLKREGIPPSLPPFKGGGGTGMSEDEEWAIKAKAIYEALGVKPPPPPTVEQLERDRYYLDLRRDIFERARKKMGEIPGEEFEPRRVPVRKPYGQSPYFDPLYSEPVLAMAGYQEGGEIGEPIVIDRVPNDPSWEGDFYQNPNPDEAPYYPTQYIEPQEPPWWQRMTGGLGEAIERAYPDPAGTGGPAGQEDDDYAIAKLLRDIPVGLWEGAKEAYKTVSEDPTSQGAFREYWTAAAMLSPFAPKGARFVKKNYGGPFRPGASSEAGIFLSPGGGRLPPLPEGFGAVEKAQWDLWKTPEGSHPTLKVDEAGNYYQAQGTHEVANPDGTHTSHVMVKQVEKPQRMQTDAEVEKSIEAHEDFLASEYTAEEMGLTPGSKEWFEKKAQDFQAKHFPEAESSKSPLWRKISPEEQRRFMEENDIFDRNEAEKMWDQSVAQEQVQKSPEPQQFPGKLPDKVPLWHELSSEGRDKFFKEGGFKDKLDAAMNWDHAAEKHNQSVKPPKEPPPEHQNYVDEALPFEWKNSPPLPKNWPKNWADLPPEQQQFFRDRWNWQPPPEGYQEGGIVLPHGAMVKTRNYVPFNATDVAMFEATTPRNVYYY